MPLGKTPILLTDMMAEGDTNKHILFNDAVLKLEDSFNREIEVDLAASDVTLTETQLLNYGLARFTGATVARTVTIPATINGGANTTNRVLIVRNGGTASILLTHDNAGIEATIPSGNAGIIYCNGTDIISLAGVAPTTPKPVNDEGVEVVSDYETLDFVGGVTVTDAGGGVVQVAINNDFTALDDTPADLTGGAGRPLVVNATEDGVEVGSFPSSSFLGVYTSQAALETAFPSPAEGSYAYVDTGVGSDITLVIWDDTDGAYVASGSAGAETEVSIKTKYEANADTNAFTDAEKTKLAGIETGATADQTGAEIVTAINTELGGTDWQTGGGSAGIALSAETANYTAVDGDFVGNVVKKMNVASGNTFTVNSGITNTEPVIVIQTGAGQTTIVAGSGVTINSAGGLMALRAQFSSCTLIPDGADTYLLIGDLV